MELELKHIEGFLKHKLKVQYIGVRNGNEIAAYEKQFKKDNPEDFFRENEYNPPAEDIGLKVSTLRKVEVWKNHVNYLVGAKNFGLKLFCYTNMFKPILRPLSDLFKDEYYSLYLDLCDELGSNNCEYLIKSLQNKKYYAFDIQKYEILEEWMNKNFFDWKYDLINKGIAVDINTL